MMERFDNPEERMHERHTCSVAVGVIGGSALLGAGTSLFAGQTQANAATNAMNAADTTQQNMYNNNLNLTAPYRSAGNTALNTISQDQQNGTGFAASFNPSNYINTPGYQFQMQQGDQAVQRSAAAQGGLLSGAAAKALTQYSSGLANTTYNQAYQNYLQGSQQQYNQLSGVANMGLSATNTQVANGQQTANQIANNQTSGITGAAAATAAGATGAASSINSGMGNYITYQNNQANQQNAQNQTSALNAINANLSQRYSLNNIPTNYYGGQTGGNGDS